MAILWRVLLFKGYFFGGFCCLMGTSLEGFVKRKSWLSFHFITLPFSSSFGADGLFQCYLYCVGGPVLFPLYTGGPVLLPVLFLLHRIRSAISLLYMNHNAIFLLPVVFNVKHNDSIEIRGVFYIDNT